MMADSGDGPHQLRPRPAADLRAELLSAVRRYDDAEAAVSTARGLRRRELLRVACADLLGLLDTAEVGQALSDVTSATLDAVLDAVIRKVEADRGGGPLPMKLAIIGMGRLGGGEQGYGSDADVLFVHEPVSGADEAQAAAVAHLVANEVRRLLAVPAPEPPVDVDADLRPEGRQGPLTRSLGSYVAYYARWSKVWESQALLRAAPVAGDADLGARFIEAIAPIRWPPEGLAPGRRPRDPPHQGARREGAAAARGRPDVEHQARSRGIVGRRVDRAVASAALRGSVSRACVRPRPCARSRRRATRV